MNQKDLPPGTRPEGVRDEREAGRAVREMFAGIVPRYDLLNRLLSLSLDRLWRRRTAREVAGRLDGADSSALDLCCGTADLALALRRVSAGRIVGVDYVHEMLLSAAAKVSDRQAAVELVEADALALPFVSNTFDVVAAAFGFRNLANYRRGLAEIHRVLKPGGEAAILEFTLPRAGWLGAAYNFYFRRVLPRVGRWVSGHPGAYSYLPASVDSFPDCDEFTRWVEGAGFCSVRYQRWSGGSVALHCGVKR